VFRMTWHKLLAWVIGHRSHNQSSGSKFPRGEPRTASHGEPDFGTKSPVLALPQTIDARGARMARRHGTGETLQSARKHLIIKEIQATVARELAARSEVPKTMPRRIADLLRELHRRLRDPGPEMAPAPTQGTDERGSAGRGTSHEGRTDPTRPSPMGRR
jgi:hypothetical protein